MSISSLINELKSLENEIKTTTKYLHDLKSKKNDIEQSIITFLKTHNLPGFKYDGQIYQPQLSKTYRKKKKGEKVDNIKRILESSGVTSIDDNVITDVFTVFKSKPIPVERIKTQREI